MKLASYWLDTAPPFVAGAAGDVGGRADVVVIGGGFTGLSAALALARRGAAVVVLESGRVAGEASGRNGGQCNNGLAHDFGGLAGRLGRERARALYRAHTDAVDSVERVVREEAIACDFHRRGRLKLAAKPAHAEHLARAAEVLQAEVDPSVRFIPGDQLKGEIASSKFHAGLLQPSSAQLNPGKLGAGLAEAAARRGVRIYENAAVTRIERTGTGHRVVSARGSIEAAEVLIATGASTHGPFGWFRRRIVPVGSFIVVTEPLPAAQLDRLLPTRRGYVTSKNVGNYFRATEENRLLFGGRARFAMSNPTSDRKSGDVLRATLAQVFPELAKVGIDYCWGGLVDMTADRLPRAGRKDGLHYAMGFSGHGVQMSVHMGQIMAEVLTGRPEANPLQGLGWPAVPGHFGKPWFLPFVGAYYRLQDVLH